MRVCEGRGETGPNELKHEARRVKAKRRMEGRKFCGKVEEDVCREKMGESLVLVVRRRRERESEKETHQDLS